MASPEAAQLRSETRRKITQGIRQIQPQAGKNLKDLEVPKELFEFAKHEVTGKHATLRFNRVDVYSLLLDDLRRRMNVGQVGSILEGWKLASVSLFRYAVNLVLAPNRAEFKKMKLSSSYYVYNIARKLYHAEKVFLAMGYRHTDREKKEGQDLVYEGDVNLVSVLDTATDLLVMHEEVKYFEAVLSRHGGASLLDVVLQRQRQIYEVYQRTGEYPNFMSGAHQQSAIQDRVTSYPTEHLSHQQQPPQFPPRSEHHQKGHQGLSGLEVGSVVQIANNADRTGVIRWVGNLPGVQGLIAGVELDEYMEGCTDGEWHGHRYFTCHHGRGLYCPLANLRPDTRLGFADSQQPSPATIALQLSKYKQSRELPFEAAIHEGGLLISNFQETGRSLGKGSYGEVVEVKVNRRLYAAKKLHDIFNAQDVPSKDKIAMAERFEKECRRILHLKHPNIVEMIGVHFNPATRSPTLVMELMDTSLCSYLEKSLKSAVTLATKYSILHNVASGLLYLHTLPPPLGPIWHRDLTANNILLNQGGKMVAKIADLGQAKNDPVYATRRQQLSQVPGNEAHMPPEAWLEDPAYNASLDVFSFGVVILHTLTHEWPKPLGRLKTATEVRLEVDRRKPYLDMIEGSPLKPLVIQCLSQEPESRPATNEILLEITPTNPLQVPEWEDQDQHIAGDQIVKYIGDERGIQGHQNSCYLDATIFGLFALSDVFDSLFLDNAALTSLQISSPVGPAQQVQREISSMLWKGIVNPLRQNGAVRYDSVMRLREKLDELGKMEGVKTSEKDPEEFLNMLFKHTLHVEPFIHIKRPFGVEPEFFVQLFVEFDESLKVPTIQNLLAKMCQEQQISFTEVPSKLLVQVPRYGKQYQTYKRIVPGIKFDPAPLIDTPYKCFICDESARKDCKECKDEFKEDGESVHFCHGCCELVHKNKRRSHKTKICQEQEDALAKGELELLSVLCIETSHYVCFSRDSEGRWLFFDSMANRIFDQYNIPRGVDCTDQLREWVYEGDQERLMAAGPRELPELVRRFTQDVYMCVYIQPDYGMYG